MSHLKLVPKRVPTKLRDLPLEIRADLDAVLAAVEEQIPIWDVAGYGLRKEKPEYITVVQRNTNRSFDIDIRSIPERTRQTDAYIDVLFEHYDLR